MRPEPVKAPELQLDEDLAFQERQWRVERLGWALLAALLLVAALGLFGGGWVGTRRSAGGLEVSAPRFAHRTASQQLSVSFPASGEREVELRVDRSITRKLRVDRILPAPTVERLEPDATVFVFSTRPGSGRLAVTFHLAGTSMGVVSGKVAVRGEPPVRLWQLLYP